jgi:predicted alpha/beta-hydrolase family hydrolase
MVTFAHALSGLGLRHHHVQLPVPNSAAGRLIGGRSSRSCYRAVIDASRLEMESARRCLVIGGKSMGGRIATQVAAADPEIEINGLVLLGCPLHPPDARPGRETHHRRSAVMLFVQGSRDAFGTPSELAPVWHLL